MVQIARLPLQVANQIAAGEVIERPASVVKELVENAIDAGARRIVIEVKDGGRWIKVVDDGNGIAASELALAFERFTTSKLRDEESLWRLATHGFRGEALASIASIAKVSCQSRAKGSHDGAVIDIEGGEVRRFRSQACAVGCSILVDELFYNTPARLKFLRSPVTEHGHIHDVVLGLSLCHPQLDFRLTINGRDVINTVGFPGLIDVVTQLFRDTASDHYLKVGHDEPCGRVHGLVCRPEFARADRSRQYLFINQRWVRHSLLTKAVEESLQGHLHGLNHPVFVLFLELDPQRVDINVHPAKKEVRLHQTQRTYYLIREAILKALAVAPLQAHQLPPPFPARSVQGAYPGISATQPSLSVDGLKDSDPCDATVTWQALAEFPLLATWNDRFLIFEQTQGLLIVSRNEVLEAIARVSLQAGLWQWHRLQAPIVLELLHPNHSCLMDALAQLAFPVEARDASTWQIVAHPHVMPAESFRHALRRTWRLIADEQQIDTAQALRAVMSAITLPLQAKLSQSELHAMLSHTTMHVASESLPGFHGFALQSSRVIEALEPDTAPL